MKRAVLFLALAAAALFTVAATTPKGLESGAFDWRLPAGVAPPPVPADNPMSAAKVELGRRLFYEADLSIDGTMSCATCHEQKRGFTDSNRTRPGVHGDPGRRNIMTLAGVGYFRTLTWADRRETGLERQVRVPLFGQTPVEMGMAGQEAELARRLSQDACYRQMFRDAFPEADGRIDVETVSKALAAFQRTLLAFDTPYDRGVMSAQARAGERLFRSRRLGCAGCHAGPHFTDAATSDDAYHRLPGAASADRGLAESTGRDADTGRFRTPGLRNVAASAPYLHDGSAATLPDAIARHYAPGDRAAPSPADTARLGAFLEALTDEGFLRDPRHALPRTACGRPL
ncbi:cytochrome c peroxidase [Phenylobacterium sp.]|uniref:cytochrome c peroxidase n=1 Tax=Phenylobacterium sp. TaxID=1871053 RepID=UPI00301BE74C